ncbi:MAG: hypothetical protein ACUZ8E_03420 [Candidatus Anammoxibacter sp.]
MIALVWGGTIYKFFFLKNIYKRQRNHLQSNFLINKSLNELIAIAQCHIYRALWATKYTLPIYDLKSNISLSLLYCDLVEKQIFFQFDRVDVFVLSSVSDDELMVLECLCLRAMSLNWT